MRALITGAGGQVGRGLAAHPPAGVTIIEAMHADLDIANADAVVAMIENTAPDLIVNAAAYTAVDQAEREPDLARLGNEVGPGNLARAAAKTGARLIHISTDFVFDGSGSIPYAPDAAPAPLGVYGATKLAGERAVLSAHARASIVLRTAWVYSHAGKNFMRTMLRLMQEKGAVRVVADQVGAPTSAASVAAAIWALAAAPDCHGVVHWTDAGVASWYDFAVAIAEEACNFGLLERSVEVTPITTADYPTPAERPRYSVLDTRATTERTGLKPTHWRTNLRTELGEMRLG